MEKNWKLGIYRCSTHNFFFRVSLTSLSGPGHPHCRDFKVTFKYTHLKVTNRHVSRTRRDTTQGHKETRLDVTIRHTSRPRTHTPQGHKDTPQCHKETRLNVKSDRHVSRSQTDTPQGHRHALMSQ